MTLAAPIIDPSPLEALSFFDDFIGAAYDNEVWTLGGITVTSQNSVGGRISLSGGRSELRLGNIGVFSAAKNARIIWRGVLTQGSGSAECGLDGAGNQSTEWIAWYRNGANYQCQCGAGGSTTTVDSLIVGDSNSHLFEILLSTGSAQFYLDNVFITTIATNVTTAVLQPYVWLVGTGTANMDYVLVQGDR